MTVMGPCADPFTIPDAETLIAFHKAQAQRFGGADGLRDRGLVDACVGRLRSALGYAEMTPAQCAALIGHAVLRNHPFVDGNKRTALGAIIMTLHANGLRLQACDRELAATIVETAATGRDHHALAAWLAGRIEPLGASLK